MPLVDLLRRTIPAARRVACRGVFHGTFRDTLRAGVAGAVALALPNLCVLCGNSCGNSSRHIVCRTCDAAYWNEPRLRCVQCALPLAVVPAHVARGTAHRSARRDYRCARCRDAPPPFDATLALADYRPPLDALALDLKFRARIAIGAWFAERLAHAAVALPAEPADAPGTAAARAGLPDVLAPVPLARARLVERGYNQAWEIARPLARALAVPAAPALIARRHDTAPQSRLDEASRHANVARAFAVTGDVRGRHVGIVDDVMTSGATLAALAATLRHAGARRVTNFVALRTARD
ncbi:MAG: hypothetical protein GAK40_00723 [Burkholderia plantarii]|nr:MAG: hypothetical protein GAK40_00723 [Burkholderia plantarii]